MQAQAQQLDSGCLIRWTVRRRGESMATSANAPSMEYPKILDDDDVLARLRRLPPDAVIRRQQRLLAPADRWD
jgi:hypothetical protein